MSPTGRVAAACLGSLALLAAPGHAQPLDDETVVARARSADSVTPLETALRLDPDSVAALMMLAQSHHRLGRREQALEFYERLKARDPEQAREISNLIRP